MLLSVVALPFVGFKGLELLGDNNFTLYLLLLSFAWAPIIFRYLKWKQRNPTIPSSGRARQRRAA